MIQRRLLAPLSVALDESPAAALLGPRQAEKPTLALEVAKTRPAVYLAGMRAQYEYDFGDGWEHDVELEAVGLRVPSAKYPRCLAGERACPPEDCGGPPGYERLLEILANPAHEEYDEMLEWVGGQFDANAFAAERVRFDNPKVRWRKAFGGRRSR